MSTQNTASAIGELLKKIELLPAEVQQRLDQSLDIEFWRVLVPFDMIGAAVW